MKKFIRGKSEVPASGAIITDEDVEILHKVVDDRWYTEHTWCRRFQKKLQEVMWQNKILLTNSGSSSSLLAISTIAETSKRGQDFIITCAMGFPTTVAPIYQTGKIPIYIDINPWTLAPDDVQLESALKRYKDLVAGVVLTHNLGYPFREDLVRLLIPMDVPFVLDCCDALGAEFDNAPVGYHSADIMTLSFFPAHHITTAEGGALLTNDLRYYDIARSFANWGRSCYCLPGQQNSCGKRFEWETDLLPEGYDHKYIFDRLGYNLKMTEFQAGLGWSQIDRLYIEREIRRSNSKYLLDNLSTYKEWLIFPSTPTGYNPFGFPIIVTNDFHDFEGLEQEFTAQELIAFLEKRKIRTRRFFGGNLTRQPAFQNLPYKTVGKLYNSDFIMRNGFWIGCHAQLTREMMDYVVEAFDEFFKSKGL